MPTSGDSRACSFSVLVQGDERVDFDAVFKRHRPALERYLARLTGDPEVAADAAQDVFVRLLEHRPPAEALPAWLYRVGTNLVRDAHRRQRTRTVLGISGRASLSHGDPPRRPDAGAEFTALQRKLLDALDQLTPRERQALLMREAGFKHREIADVLGTTTASIGTLLGRAIEKMAERLGPLGKGV